MQGEEVTGVLRGRRLGLHFSLPDVFKSKDWSSPEGKALLTEKGGMGPCLDTGRNWNARQRTLVSKGAGRMG